MRHVMQAKRHPIATRKETFAESCVHAQQNHVHERHEDPKAATAMNTQQYASGSQKLAMQNKQAKTKPTDSQIISGENFAVAIFSWNTLIKKNPRTMKTATNAAPPPPEKSCGPMGKPIEEKELLKRHLPGRKYREGTRKIFSHAILIRYCYSPLFFATSKMKN